MLKKFNSFRFLILCLCLQQTFTLGAAQSAKLNHYLEQNQQCRAKGASVKKPKTIIENEALANITKRLNELRNLLNSEINSTTQRYEQVMAKLNEEKTEKTETESTCPAVHIGLTTEDSRPYDEHLNCLDPNCKTVESCDDIGEPRDFAFAFKWVNTTLPPFYGYCYADNQSWLVIQRREDGSVDFYRNWNDYKYGFGNVNGEHWIGLERLYQITHSGDYELTIIMEDFKGEVKFVRYAHFEVASEADRYRLTVKTLYNGNVRDYFTKHNGRVFSTYDNQDPSDVRNCAEGHRSGWWFERCFYINLNAHYYQESDKKTWTGIWAIGWKMEALKRSIMYIRPSTHFWF